MRFQTGRDEAERILQTENGRRAWIIERPGNQAIKRASKTRRTRNAETVGYTGSKARHDDIGTEMSRGLGMDVRLKECKEEDQPI